jgi:Cof subfamily protein (haloacid dehalogenase superfamily)
MKTLFISDLDGTLLHSNEKISQYTCDVINKLTESGVLFSYATARSFVTACKVTAGLNAKIPLIIYNGAFIVENCTGTVMLSNYFTNEARIVIEQLLAGGVVPIVYAYIDGVEKFSFVFDKCSCGMKAFLFSRTGDIRANSVADICQLYNGDIFYITCIDEEKKLKPFYDKYKADFNCVYQRDIYSGEQWLEIMPKSTSKANAVMSLKKHLNAQKVVVFGDGRNDIDMFKIADESYAVKNAVDDLKNIATGVIDMNDNDAVAKWLKENIGVIS